MLQQLSIQNFALIDQIVLDFEEGLTVITGETGAGKSILLGALGLILGNRADHSSLKDDSKKCIVEGKFDLADYDLQTFFDHYDLDYADDTILRREINRNGKSRSFINDTPVTLEVLKLLGSQLIDIHSQQQSLQINDLKFQLSVLDSVANNTVLLSDYQQLFRQYKSICKEIEMFLQSLAKVKQEEDFLNFQFQELEELNIKSGENGKLETEQTRFANGEEILRNLNQIQQVIGEQDENVLSQIGVIKQLVNRIEAYDESFPELSKRVSSISIELDDIFSEIEQKAGSFEYDSERHQIVEERLAEIHRLQQKHLLNHPDELITLQNEIEQKLNAISFSDEKLERLTKERNELELQLGEMANKLSDNRKMIIPSLEKEVINTLEQLGIPYAQMKVTHKTQDNFTISGLDSFEFLFSANKGVIPGKVAKSASGGEISRLMLSIKNILAEHQQMPTILFDEIDTGVSGEIAEKMGLILDGMGKKRQVISITHLPQLAAKGRSHYFVYKEVVNDRSITLVKKLMQEERVNEVAKMLSGKEITEAAMNNAKELLAH